ncbi:DUF1614 domain-containing protein [Acetohalobium arabaticum]|uniref:DUF1614 domain-containing protein n=1 Tax=Acetohalobium arabaticum (strain ATCC 49924 / DSM 5501 / Z-7288) TaxID=574087 RepID=D9QPX3_ACEAZ|nr:DUF1614 domain-containing protein [Acetohalobium arabaticum]ADL12564.1 protein of unknown function DUF1614 [Acetohalobium arabaticum DSM 5501]
MSFGILLLVAAGILIYLGFAERILDRMYLTDSQALIFIGLLIAGSYIDIPITNTPPITINVGGAILPVVLGIYILVQADYREVVRALISIIATGGVIYALTQIYQFEEGHTLLDPSYLFGVIAGITAYLTSRSRRSAFLSGTLGFLLYDLIHVWQITFGGVTGRADIGGAGALDTIILAGLIAVVLTEIVGESRERLETELTENNQQEDRRDLDKMEVGDLNGGEDDE